MLLCQFPAIDVSGHDSLASPGAADGSNDYSWDFDNQLTGADTDGTAGNDVTFEYDALGRRVRKDDGTDDVVYVRARQQVIAEYAFAAAAGSPTEQYVYGSYIDEPLIKDGTLSSGTGLVYYHHDRRYSVIALTDSSGNVVERYAYSPYGELSLFNGSGSSISGTAYANAITYTGRWWDDETELYYFRARYYDCSVGVFIGRDPLEYVDGMSLYRGYFQLDRVDPLGFEAIQVGMTTHLSPNRPIYWDPDKKFSKRPDGKPFACFYYDSTPSGEVPIDCPNSTLPPTAKDGPAEGGDPNGGTVEIPGVNVNFWGEGEARSFTDFAVAGCPKLDIYQDYLDGRETIKRPLTSDLPDKSVDNVLIRNSPFRLCEMKEICRICRGYCTVTVAKPGLFYKDAVNVFKGGVGSRRFAYKFHTYKSWHPTDPERRFDVTAISFLLRPGDCNPDSKCP